MDNHDGFAESLMAKSDQITAAELMGITINVKIAGLTVKNSEKQKWTMRLEGNDKFFRPCLGMRRLIAEIWGGPENYAGGSMTLYRETDTRYGADEVGGVRISHMTGIEAQIEVTVPIRRGVFRTYLIRPLRVEAPKPAPTTAAPENAFELAHAAASKGTDAFKEWWNSDVGKTCREAVKPNMAEIKATAAAADAATTDEAPM